jgi:hypothetical protein
MRCLWNLLWNFGVVCLNAPFMVAGEAAVVRHPHDTQWLGDGALAWGQNGASNQNQDVVSDRRCEARAEHRPVSWYWLQPK